MTAREADILLDTIRGGLLIPVAAVQLVRDGVPVWRIEAADPPHRYAAESPDYGQAALGLAELVGFDVMDG